MTAVGACGPIVDEAHASARPRGTASGVEHQRWRLMLTVGTPSDPTGDATLPWPADRHTVDAGLLTLDSVETDARGNARDINFDPLVLPPGIEPSDDPLLSARSAVYAASYRRRTGETTSPPAVQVDKVAL